MKYTRMIYLSASGLLIFTAFAALNTMARGAYESAEYKVVEKEGKFEVREYGDLMLVATRTKLDAQGRDGSFMKLFRYISGANASDKKIAMTTPVFMENDKSESAVQMGFVMPKEIADSEVPAPTGQGVEVRKRLGGRFAVVRFSGQMSTKAAKEAEAKLRSWMESKGLVADDAQDASGVETAGYDPPFTPGPLRRNEVLIRLKE
ncbi:MAG: SOUL family heme-binding protein [Planctomycetota bacterium]